jgi:hypothetical protein
MSRTITTLLLGVAVLACTMAVPVSHPTTSQGANRPPILLERTPLSATVPRGFVLETAIHAPYPLLAFSLPEGPDGGTPGSPSLELHADTSLLDLKQFVERRRQSLDEVSPPKERRVAGLPAVEIEGTLTTIYDFVGGGSATGRSLLHSIAFVHQGRVYICELNTEIEEHAKYEPALYELCDSVRATSPR